MSALTLSPSTLTLYFVCVCEWRMHVHACLYMCDVWYMHVCVCVSALHTCGGWVAFINSGVLNLWGHDSFGVERPFLSQGSHVG